MDFENIISFESFKKRIKAVFFQFAEDESLFSEIKPINGKPSKHQF